MYGNATLMFTSCGQHIEIECDADTSMTPVLVRALHGCVPGGTVYGILNGDIHMRLKVYGLGEIPAYAASRQSFGNTNRPCAIVSDSALESLNEI